MSKIMMNAADLQVIASVVKENDITGNFELDYCNSSGIGYTIDLIYETVVNNRNAKVIIPICGVENW